MEGVLKSKIVDDIRAEYNTNQFVLPSLTLFQENDYGDGEESILMDLEQMEQLHALLTQILLINKSINK